MAIENLALAHTDLEIRGGLQYVGLMLRHLGAITFDSAGDDHQIALNATDVFQLFDLKQGTGSLTSAGTKEGGTIMFEHTVYSICSKHFLCSLEQLRNIGKRKLGCLLSRLQWCKIHCWFSQMLTSW